MVRVKLIQNKDLQNDVQNNLYRVLDKYIPAKTVAKKMHQQHGSTGMIAIMIWLLSLRTEL